MPDLVTGVYDSAGCAAEFRRVVLCIDLEFLYRLLADDVVDSRSPTLFGKEGLVVVGAVDRAVVQKTGDSAEADQSEVSIRGDAGCQRNEVRPAAAVYRKFLNGFSLIVVET